MKNEEKPLKKLSAIFKNVDTFLVQLTIALAIFGLIFAFSSSTFESYRLSNSPWMIGIKQLFAFLIGITLLILCSKFSYHNWQKVTWIIVLFTIILMLLTVFTPIGKNIGGAKRWIEIGFLQFQPAEFAKLGVLLLYAKMLSLYKWNEKTTYLYLCISFFIIFIILKQPDLGTASILLLLLSLLLLLFEWPIWLITTACFSLFYLGVYKISNTSYQLDRLRFWLNPYLEPQGRGYNLIQAKYALGLGGLTGVGFGNSIQKEGYLPIPHSDFIFAVIGEEIGFIGLSVVLVLFLSWIIRGLYLLNKVNDSYGKILGTGIILLIATQATVNIMVATGLLPITGVTLPFFSCGGSSLIVTFIMCGILFNIISAKEEI